MTKLDLVREIAQEMEVTQKEAAKAMDAVIGVIADKVVDGETIRIAGFGTFDTVDVAERTGRNPQTGESLVIPAHKTPKFKYSKAIKDAVRGC
ncbi:MAG: HU family DNA-binding protein [Anaerostipes sp.]|uniref:HU family DNA-binding protein n=1 Tax=Anaerostipes sp. TaxID=1872530 RepID=UPI003992984A